MEKNEVLKIIEPIFFDKTFKEVSMQELANTLKIKKSSLYYYFPSKDKLQEELISYSFENYLNFIQKITNNNDFKKFINEFIYFPFKSKNIFSLISQNWYCENQKLKEMVSDMQNTIFVIIYEAFSTKYKLNQEKVFILLSILENISKKKCIFWNCPFDLDKIILEIDELFKK